MCKSPGVDLGQQQAGKDFTHRISDTGGFQGEWQDMIYVLTGSL